MKRCKQIITLIISAIILTMSFMPSLTVYADYSVPSYVRVGLYYGSNAKKEVTVSSENGFQLGIFSGTAFIEKDNTKISELTVCFEENGISVKSNGSAIYSTPNVSEGLGLFPTKGGMDRRLKINGEEYRGGLDFKEVGGSNVITNVVFLNNYLYGVISREMSPSWHTEALKAQAVCARNYAIQNIGKHNEYGFDLCNTTCCQTYSGTRFETENSYLPVDETSNQVLSYGGELAELYYFASGGKRTENVKNVWGYEVPYLVSVDNSYEDTENITNGIWTGTLGCDEASTIMRNKGYDVGEVTDIKAIEYSENGRVTKLEVTGTNGSKVFEREACRTIFNTVTKSQEFTVKGNGEAGENVPSIMVSDGIDVAEKKVNEIIMLTSEGRARLESKKLFVTNGVYQQIYETTSSAEAENTGFVFNGTGWGHGVGMSQYGAKGMAEAGYGYVDILLHYFPGTNLENAY